MNDEDRRRAEASAIRQSQFDEMEHERLMLIGDPETVAEGERQQKRWDEIMAAAKREREARPSLGTIEAS